MVFFFRFCVPPNVGTTLLFSASAILVSTMSLNIYFLKTICNVLLWLTILLFFNSLKHNFVFDFCIFGRQFLFFFSKNIYIYPGHLFHKKAIFLTVNDFSHCPKVISSQIPFGQESMSHNVHIFALKSTGNDVS